MARTILAICVFATTIAKAASAQEPEPPSEEPPPHLPAPPPLTPRKEHFHDGFYLRMSLGAGALSVTSNAERTADKAFSSGFGMALDVLVGGTPMPGLAIGGGMLTTTAFSANVSYDGMSVPAIDANSRDLPAVLIGPMLDAFPNPAMGFHFGGLLGIGEVGNGGRAVNQSNGVGISVWAGYDVWVAPQWSLGGLLRVSALGTGRAIGPDPVPREVSDDTLTIAAVFTALYH